MSKDSETPPDSNNLRVLLVEDDREVNRYISESLTAQGYALTSSGKGDEALALAQSNSYDVMILDRMLPGMDGLTMLRALRDAGNQTPALILSALGDVDDRVEGLKAGGDDYLVKPFALVELLARVEVLARRNQPSTHSEIVLQGAGISMDLLARRVTRDGQPIALQAREFKLLEYLLRNKNQIVTRTMLLEHVWQYHFDPQTNVIDVHISRLRQKIDADPAHSIIRTIRGSGYVIADSDADIAA
jgi:two-component system OmpR family response regulator